MRKLIAPAITALIFTAGISMAAAEPPHHSNRQEHRHQDAHKDGKQHHERKVIHRAHRAKQHAKQATQRAHRATRHENRATDRAHHVIRREHRVTQHARHDIHRARRLSRHELTRWRRNVHAHHRYRWHAYHRPHGWYRHHWRFGEYLPRAWWARDYWIDDWSAFGLLAPPYGYVWVRVGNDALLIDSDTGEVLRVVYDIFY